MPFFTFFKKSDFQNDLNIPLHQKAAQRNFIINGFSFAEFCVTRAKLHFGEFSNLTFQAVSWSLLFLFLLGCLQATHSFIFPRNTTRPGRACPAIEKVRKTCVKLRFWIKNLRFPLVNVKFSYGGLTFVGTSATECKFLLFHLKYLILYEAFIDVCIFKLTFYDAFLTIAMQKYREGCTFSSKISASRRRNPTLESASGSAGSAGSGVIGRGAQPQ